MLVAVGRIGNGVAHTNFDRRYFLEEGKVRHLSDAEIARIDDHLHQGKEKLSEDEQEAFGQHVRGCGECSAKIMSLPAVVFQEESIHTSKQPLSRKCNTITPPVKDIRSWDEVSPVQPQQGPTILVLTQ